jgi:hypothetical protein
VLAIGWEQNSAALGSSFRSVARPSENSSGDRFDMAVSCDDALGGGAPRPLR